MWKSDTTEIAEFDSLKMSAINEAIRREDVLSEIKDKDRQGVRSVITHIEPEHRTKRFIREAIESPVPVENF